MIPLFIPELDRTVALLKKYDPESAIPLLSGLLTMPELEANTMRIETLVHLSVAHCQGNIRIRSADIDILLNGHLGKTQVATIEDPPEDVFVTNIETDVANFLIFQSIWESNDYYLQAVMDVLGKSEVPSECRDLFVPALALLTLSDRAAKRVGLERWNSTPSTPIWPVTLPQESKIVDHAKAVTFTVDDLNALNIERDWLTPFILEYQNRHTLSTETIGNTSLERYPLVELDGRLIMALPHAVSPAIRRFVLGALESTGYLELFSKALAEHQAKQVHDRIWELRKDSEPLKSIPPPSQVMPSLHAWSLKYDTDKYVHLLLLHDHTESICKYGLDSTLRYTDDQETNLQQYLSDVSNYCNSLLDFTEGIILFIVGGLGRRIELKIPELPEKWYFSLLSIADLLTLGASVERPVRSYLKLIKYKKWAENRGVSFLNTNGDFNLYCHWRGNNYRLVPHEKPISPGTVVSVGTNSVQSTRERVRNLVDRHVIRTVEGNYVSVMRTNKDAYFPSLHTLPVYVSLSHLIRGKLVGAVETSRGPSWLVMTVPVDPRIAGNFDFNTWSGFADIYARLVSKFEAKYTQLAAGPVLIHINFEDVEVPHGSNEMHTNQPEVTINSRKKTADIRFPLDMMKHFMKVENVGEKMVIRCMTMALICLHHGKLQDQIDEDEVAQIADRVIGDSGIRIIHWFSTHNPIELLQIRQDRGGVEISTESINFRRLLLSEDCNSAIGNAIIESKKECNRFLHCVVDKVWKRLQLSLNALDRACLIGRMCELYETCLSDQELWRRTAKATSALYGSTDDILKVFGRQATDRTSVSISIRAIVEMAICECPVSAGKRVSGWEVDDLLADAKLLIEAAMHSDAIYNNLVDPIIELHDNGEFSIDPSVYQKVVDPFVKAYRSTELSEAVRKYGEYYRSESTNYGRIRGDVWSGEFIRAFQTEFGLTPNDVRKCFAGLADMAVERDCLVVETTLGNIRKRLTIQYGIAPDSCDAFIQTFGFFHRPEWDKPPAGFENKDIYPWRFRRRLSSTVKPILIFGQQSDDPVIFGVGALRLGCAYLLEWTEDGRLPNEFYKSQEMKRYIGAVSSEKGHAFARSVSQEMHDKGWHVKNEVKMRSLGAPSELGDVDVLAWRPDGSILIIECKRLQFARTIVEVAEICERFQGEAKDELDRHIQRVKWIKNNPACLEKTVGYLPDSSNVDDRLITSTHVPMKYLESLPIDTKKIGPLEKM